MINAPYTYKDQELSDYFGLQPSAVRGSANVTTSYYGRILLNIIFSLFDIKVPEKGGEMLMEIPKNYLRFWLYIYGTFAVLYTKKFGWVIAPYTVSEFDFYYQPKQIVVTNRFFDDRKIGIVGANCEIVKIFDDYRGVTSIISQYAEMLAACDKAVNINLMQVGLGKLLGVPDKKSAEVIKSAYGHLTEGLPIATINKEIFNDGVLKDLIADLSQPFIGDKVHELKRSIMNDFLTTVGINNANINKRERLNADEVNANNDEVETIKTIMLENLQDSFEKVNALSGLNFSVEERFDSSYIDSQVGAIVGGESDE